MIVPNINFLFSDDPVAYSLESLFNVYLKALPHQISLLNKLVRTEYLLI